MMHRRAFPLFCLVSLLLASCAGELTVEGYADLLADRLEAASHGEDPDAVLVERGVDHEDYARFELEVLSRPDLASRVLEVLRRDHPDLLPPEPNGTPGDMDEE